MSQSLAVASQAPDTNVFKLGASDKLSSTLVSKMTMTDSKDLPHHVAGMVAKLDHAHARFDIPEHAGHVAGRRDDLAVVDEPAAAEVAGVRAELAGALGTGTVLAVQVVDRADVVQTAAGDEVAGGGVGAGHDPARPERDSVNLVRRVRVPNDELAVLGGRDEVSAVRSPVHGVDLREVSTKCATRAHDDTREGVDFGGHSTN
jgi:hypothetical protein